MTERTSSRRENVTAKRETEKHCPVHADWCCDVFSAMEQVCEEVNLIARWVDSLDTLDEITEHNFSAWVRTKGQNVLGIQWALQQLYTVLTQIPDWASEGVHSGRDGKGNDPRSDNFEDWSFWTLCHTPRRQDSYDELAELLPAWEKKVREPEKFAQSALSNDQKIGFLRHLVNDDLEQFLSHLSPTGGQTYERLRVYAESQIAQRRTAQSYHPGKTSDTKTEKTRGNAMDLGNLDNASKTDVQETRQAECDPWQENAGQGSEVLDAPGV